MNQTKILVVDDDREIVGAIKKRLELEDYQVLAAYDGLEAMDILMSQDVQLLIIDVMMPKMDGLSATMKIRESKNIPIIILSAKTEESDKILGLSMGADDYVSKPFRPDELVARVKSQLRRYMQLGSMSSAKQSKDKIVNGGLILDTEGKRILVDGEPVKLTATEYKILYLLMNHLGRVFSADEIYERVWQEEAYATENTVMVHIRRIREKIEIDTKNPKYLKVVWGIGYKMEKWINTLCIAVVICLMTAGGVYGLNGTNGAASLQTGVSLDEFEENGYFTNLFQQGLLFQWSKEQGYSLETEDYQGISRNLLDKLEDEMDLDADLVFKPYGKKTVREESQYGSQKADFQGGNTMQMTIQRDQSEQINQAGQFVNWENGYEGQYDPENFYQVSGDMMITLPEGLLINGEEGRRLESGTMRIRITQKGMDLIEQEYKKEQTQLIRYVKEMTIILGLEVLGVILLIVLSALQGSRTRFFRWLDHIWWEVILLAAFWIGVGLIGLYAWTWSVGQDYMMGLTDQAQEEMIVMICSFLVPALIALAAVCIQTTVWRLKEHKLLDSTLCIGYFRKWYRNSKKRNQLEYEAMSFEQQHVKDRITGSEEGF